MTTPAAPKRPRARRLAGLTATAMLLFSPSARAAAKVAPAAGRGVYDFRVATADSGTHALSDYRGKVLLIVNTASRCGFTPQYESLEAAYRKYQAQGLEILAFPANNFMNQEPGSDAAIQSFCTLKYHTTFPVFAKIDVRGKHISPLYAWLTRESAFPGDIPWNFTKFVVSRTGAVVGRFDPMVDPLDPKLAGLLESELAKH
jgi:glutathione peroxidase